MEQGLALETLNRACAGAKERRKTSHEKLHGMMVALLKTSREREAQRESRRQQSQPIAGATRRDAAPHHRIFSDGYGGSKDDELAHAEAEPGRDLLGRRRQDRGVGR